MSNVPTQKVKDHSKDLAGEQGLTTTKTLIFLFLWILAMTALGYFIEQGQSAERPQLESVYEHASLGLVMVFHYDDGSIYEEAHAIAHKRYATIPFWVDAGRGGPYTSVLDPGDNSRVYTLITEPSMYRKNPPTSWKPCTEETFKDHG